MAEDTGPLLEGSLTVFPRGLETHPRQGRDILILGAVLR